VFDVGCIHLININSSVIQIPSFHNTIFSFGK
jgi:hypothetical protein